MILDIGSYNTENLYFLFPMPISYKCRVAWSSKPLSGSIMVVWTLVLLPHHPKFQFYLG